SGVAAWIGPIFNKSLLRFRDAPAIGFASRLVNAQSLAALLDPDAGFLLPPALVDCSQAPLGALARRADWLATDQREDRIGVRRRQNAQRDPTAAIELPVE